MGCFFSSYGPVMLFFYRSSLRTLSVLNLVHYNYFPSPSFCSVPLCVEGRVWGAHASTPMGPFSQRSSPSPWDRGR